MFIVLESQEGLPRYPQWQVESLELRSTVCMCLASWYYGVSAFATLAHGTCPLLVLCTAVHQLFPLEQARLFKFWLCRSIAVNTWLMVS